MTTIQSCTGPCGGDYLTHKWECEIGGGAEPVHARAWPGVDRALCDGAPRETGCLSVEAPTDEDADVTCAACLSVIRAVAAEVRS